MLLIIVCALLGYAMGNVEAAILISRYIKKEDIRKFGSGNAGATNMLRTYGWTLGVFTFVCDLVKGVLAYLIGGWIAGPNGAAVAGVAVVMGHDWPVIYKFKGGKGIACTMGIMLAVDPTMAVIIILGGALMVALTKYVSAGSLLGATMFFLHALFSLEAPVKIMALVLAILAYIRHMANIKRLVMGTEPTLSSKKNIS